MQQGRRQESQTSERRLFNTHFCIIRLGKHSGLIPWGPLRCSWQLASGHALEYSNVATRQASIIQWPYIELILI
jgi:hypothetical protein